VTGCERDETFSMKRYTEQEKRQWWEDWKMQGKKTYIWRYGILRMGLPWGVFVFIFGAFFGPRTHELSILEYFGIAVITVIVAVLLGVFVGFTTWAIMSKKYG
jgi:hypothetical protein